LKEFSPAIGDILEKVYWNLRAIKENVSYIETEFSTIPSNINTSDLLGFNTQLRLLANRNEKGSNTSDTLYSKMLKEMRQQMQNFNTNFVAKLHNDLKIDNERFTMRYQNFVLRFMEPVDLFKNLVVAFISADSSPLMAGVNILRKTVQLP
jgi:adenosine deaminase/adenosine deaminase CECR1